MSRWGSQKARIVFRALLKIGWTIKAQKGSSHKQLERTGWGEYTWAFHDDQELGPKMLSRISKRTGLTLGDL
jgi:predicted RNA binding protein YcfA (HicA-like mRNA interferase family)